MFGFEDKEKVRKAELDELVRFLFGVCVEWVGTVNGLCELCACELLYDAGNFRQDITKK